MSVKTYWDLGRTDRGLLTDDQVWRYIRIDAMKNGTYLPDDADRPHKHAILSDHAACADYAQTVKRAKQAYADYLDLCDGNEDDAYRFLVKAFPALIAAEACPAAATRSGRVTD